jgi:predicted metalloprotease
MKRNVTEFTVQGSSPFPMDMLRYDQCWPYRGEDVSGIDSTGDWSYRSRSVTLHTIAASITPDRWRSFGWIVTDTQHAID